MDNECPFGKKVKQGTRRFIQCTKYDTICSFQKYCINKRDVVFSLEAKNCKLRNL